MMYASDFRKAAREALRGKWIRTTLILLLAGLLFAGAGLSTPEVNFEVEYGVQYNIPMEQLGVSRAEIQSFLRIMSIALMVLNLLSIFIGSLTRVGMFRVGDAVLGGETPRAGMLFPKGIYWKAVGVRLLTTLFVLLWSMLFIFPGIIASYRYAMAEYLLMKNPELSPMEAIELSKRYMYGNKLRMFCLELSFFGWNLLAAVPLYIAMFIIAGANMPVFTPAMLIIFGAAWLISMIGFLFLSTYTHVSICAFFRSLENPWREQQARSGFNWESYAGTNGEAGDAAEEAEENEAPVYHHSVDNEPAAKALFHRYGCSRNSLREAGELETYENYRIDSSVENRWLRERGQALMLRFSHDPATLDDLLTLIGEYGMDDLLDRVLERIERHIRQSTLPAEELLNMVGRALALAKSGVFADRPSYVERKQAQVRDMAERIARVLEETDPEGSWQDTLHLIRGMCN